MNQSHNSNKHLRKVSKFMMPLMTSLMMAGCGALEKASKEKKADKASELPTASDTGKSADSSQNATSIANLNNAPKGFLTIQDLAKPKNLIQYSSNSLVNEVQLEDDFFPSLAGRSKSSNSDDGDSDQMCMNAKMNALPLKYQNQWLSYEGDLDVTACYKKLPERSVVKSSKMKIFVATFLDQYRGDGSEFKDKKISDFVDLSKKFSEPSGQGKVLTGEVINIRVEQEYEPMETESKGTASVRKFISISSSKGSTGGACRGESIGDNETLTDCVKTKVLTFINTNDLPVNQFTQSTFKNVTGPSKGPFFASGDIEFEISEWTGKVSYTGQNNGPKWQAQKGSDFAQGELKARE